MGVMGPMGPMGPAGVASLAAPVSTISNASIASNPTNTFTPDNTKSDIALQASTLQQQSSLIGDIQNIFRNELLSIRSLESFM
jgi:hypothetical protein